jgi:TPP-dependent pyruvate/acetoin dehydrogenase alpha subunit
VAYVGEGAANQGAFHEVMNMAGLWKLGFICVIEDNNYGVSVTKSESTAVAHNSDRRQRLLDEQVASSSELESLDERIRGEIDAAMKFAREAEYPAPTEALERVYA